MRRTTLASCLLEIIALLLVACTAGVRGIRCLSCSLSERTECGNGTEAIKHQQLVVNCKAFCEVQQQLRVRADGSAALRHTVRGCADQARTSCADRAGAPLRDCVATCATDLCNVYDDVAERVAHPEKYVDEGDDGDGGGGGLEWYWWLVIALAVLALVVFPVVLLCVRARRQRSIEYS